MADDDNGEGISRKIYHKILNIDSRSNYDYYNDDQEEEEIVKEDEEGQFDLNDISFDHYPQSFKRLFDQRKRGQLS